MELLYMEGCPNVGEARQAIDDVLDKLELDEVEVRLVKVATQEEAERLRFPGSPTVRVNGEDVYPQKVPQYSLSCRRYAGAFGWQGWPPRDYVEEALERVLG